MNKSIKKILSLVLVLVLTLGCLPMAASAAGSYERIAGANRYQTAFAAADALKRALGVEKFENIIVASGTGFADALAGSYLAAVKRAPILLVHSRYMDDVASFISTNLVGGGTVYLLGGEAAVPAEMESKLPGITVQRLAGSNRYRTNLQILEAAGLGSEILVCTGKDFADSLSASAVGKPILLVANKLTAEQKAVLAGGGKHFVIIGGENAVGTDVAAELEAFGSVERLAGANRYETSVLVAERFFQNPSSAVLAYARNFPDGLCGGPLAYVKGAPLLLTMSCNEAMANAYAESKGIVSGMVLGGSGLLTDGTCETVFGDVPPGHNYVTATKEPTCTEKGGETTACSKCGTVKTEGEIPATGHTPVVIETVKPQFDHDGYTKYRCETCGVEYQEEIPHPEEALRQPTEMELAVAEATIKYLKEYGAVMEPVETLTKIAQWRAYQLTEEFKHDLEMLNAITTYYRYGIFTEGGTLDGPDPSLDFYQGKCQEAIGRGGSSRMSADALGRMIAKAFYESKSHWSYVGDPDSPFSGVGAAQDAEGVWYFCVITSKQNFDVTE